MKGELYIAASALLPAIAALNGDAFTKLKEFKGRELDGLKARHPLFDRDSLLINTDYVLLDQGTGCVHTAPGHGEDDYHAGVAHDLDIYSPVGPDGRFDETDRALPGAAGVRGQRAHRRGPAPERQPAARGLHHPLLPPLLALQEAGHLPRHRAVVHRHGPRPTCAATPWRPSRE